MYRNFIKYCLFGLCYILLSLVIGECHPFSREPMYDSFPNLAITLYLSDSTGKLLPVKNNFSYNTDALTHNYHHIREMEGYDKPETKVLLNHIGKTMWAQLAPYKHPLVAAHGIAIHRVRYSLNSDTITTTDEILYQVP